MSMLNGSPPGADAAEPLCQGEVPTIVGTPGGAVSGTDSDDVIVSEGALLVDALDGGDLVCVTGGTDRSVRVDAGPGDDLIDATAAVAFRVEAFLGAGVDTYVGSAGSDHVDASAGEDSGEYVSTGAGEDKVSTGRRGRPMNDVIDLGDGLDRVFLRGLPGAGSVEGGPGTDFVQMYDRTRASWVINNRKQKLTAGSATMDIVGLERFLLESLRWKSLRFIGGPAREELDVTQSGQNKRDGAVMVDMGGADDRLVVDGNLSGPYHGGDGADRISIDGEPGAEPPTGSVGVDLLRDIVRTGDGLDAKLTSFSVVHLRFFDRNLVRAGPGPHGISVEGCHATVYGGSGDDQIRFEANFTLCSGPWSKQSIRAYGEGGADRLQGSVGNDVLIGGLGTDKATGKSGRDVCSAEARVSCERR